MPWMPELFSAPALARLEERRRQKVVDIPYFEGLVMGEVDALVGSFAGEPRLHHPLRGQIEGEEEFREFVADTESWLETTTPRSRTCSAPSSPSAASRRWSSI